MKVWLSDYSVACGSPLILKIDDHEGLGEPSDLGIHIIEIGKTDYTPWIATSAAVVEGGREIEASLTLTDFFKPGSLYEIRSLQFGDEHNDASTLVGGRDFPRVLFRTKSNADEPSASAEEVTAAARLIYEALERLYDSPLGDLGGPGNVAFRVLMFVERMMLTRPLRIPGVKLLPLRRGDSPVGNTSTDEVNIINGVLHQLGWRVSVDADNWARDTSRERPITVMHVPEVFAASEEEAVELARLKRDRLLDLAALHRGSYGIPFATAVQPLAGSQDQRQAGTTFYPEVEPFGGNLLGGEISGESPQLWLDHDQAMTDNPFVALCLSLFREAQGESNLDFAYFRFWNLLEVIAQDRVENGTPVMDFDGRELRVRGKKATTNHPEGRVYELLKRYMLLRNFVEHHFGQPLPEGLWDAVQVWYACRNATAHFGRFRPEDPAQEKWHWYPLALKAYKAVMSRGGYAWGDPYISNLQSAAEDMVRQVLGQR